MQRCARCNEEFAPARFIQDLKKTLHDVGENYSLGERAVVQKDVATDEHTDAAHGTTVATPQSLWWQDICPTCKRVMRAQANLAALGREGNQFL